MFDKRKFPKKLADLISARKENFSLRKLNLLALSFSNSGENGCSKEEGAI